MNKAITFMSTVNSVLGVVAQSANTITSTVNMGDNFIAKAAYKQERRYAVELDAFENELLLEASQSSASAKLEAAEFRKLSDEHASYYDEAQDRIAKVLKGCKRPNPFAVTAD